MRVTLLETRYKFSISLISS